MAYSISYYCLSDIGTGRSLNQDNFICENTLSKYGCAEKRQAVQGCTVLKKPSVFGVFDGMGGEERGEAASHIAASTLSAFSICHTKRRALKRYIRAANFDICRFAEENKLSSCGTTSALLLFCKRFVYSCNVGDSRIFRFSQNKLTRLSCDHSAPSVFGKKPPLMQYLGIPEKEMILSPHISKSRLRKGDIYLISSDGLTDSITEDDISEILNTCDFNDAANELMTSALRRWGKDNTTLILIKIV